MCQQIGRTRIGEGGNKLLEVIGSERVREMDARNACGRKHFGKRLFGRTRLEGNTVEQQLVFADTDQKAVFAGQNRLQQLPRLLKLFDGPLVIQTIQANVFQQDVQAACECSSTRQLVCGG